MSGILKVGEVAIGQNFVHNTDKNGAECVITGPLGVRKGAWLSHSRAPYEGLVYEVQWADGTRKLARPQNLRRRKPPTTGEEFILAMFKPATKREGAPA